MKVLITGGAGYIGSVMTRVFTEAGHEVVVLDNFTQGHRDAVPKGVRLIEGDIANFASLVTRTDAIDTVVHLAAFIAAGESMKSPEIYWRNNVAGTLAMLDAMRNLGIKQLVFASTAAVYGNPVSLPITEDAPKQPTNTYGMTKLAMDMAITSECWAHGLAATSLRFFNVAGAYQDAGERHRSETHIIPIALEVAAGKREVFTVFGNDYLTDDGTCVRDYIHVADLARAALLALDHNTTGTHAIYNLGNGSGFSNKQVVEAVETVTCKRLSVVYGERREGDPAVLVASSQKAYDELGWKPSQPSLEEMIADAWEFMQRSA